MSLKYATIRKFSTESGYSEDAIQSKIKRGQWMEGDVWIKAPDGRRLIDLEGFERWAEGSEQPVKPV